MFSVDWINETNATNFNEYETKTSKFIILFYHFVILIGLSNTNTLAIPRKLLTGHMTKILQYLRNKSHLWFSTMLGDVTSAAAAAQPTETVSMFPTHGNMMYWYISDDGCNYSCYNYIQKPQLKIQNHTWRCIRTPIMTPWQEKLYLVDLKRLILIRMTAAHIILILL